MDENNIIVAAILISLAVLSFFILKPIFMSVVFGFVLVFIFAPIYNLIHKKIKSKNLSSAIVTIILLVIIIVPLIFLIPFLLNETIKIYTFAQNLDFVTPIEKLLPLITQSESLAAEFGSVLHSFTTNISTGIFNSVSNFLMNLPVISLQLTVVFFTFFLL